MAVINPYMTFRYRIEIDGIIEAGFSEVTGLQATTQVEDYREGGVNDFTHKLPKETSYENLILKKGMTDSENLWNWHQGVVAGKFIRATVHIIMLKDRSEDVAHTWSIKEAYPVKWTGPEFKADANAIAIESLELAHHGFV